MAEVTPAPSTQEANPNQAAKRTALQVGTAALALLVLLPQIIDVILSVLGFALPENLKEALAAAAVLVTAGSTAFTRIMALPGMIAWTENHLNGFFAPAKVEKTPEQLAAEEVDLTPAPEGYTPRH